MRYLFEHFYDNPIIHFHHVPEGTPHVHERFRGTPHVGHNVIAVCGKGGVGKTAFSALLTMSCVRSGTCGKVLVVDADPAFGLAMALGIEVEKTIGEVREEIIRTAQGGKSEAERELANRLDYLVFESMIEMEGFAFLAMGRSDSIGCYCSVNDLLRDAIEMLAHEFDTIIVDGEAGLEQLNRQVLASVDELVVLTDGSNRGLRTVDLLVNMAYCEHFAEPGHVGVVLNRPLADVESLSGYVEALGAHYLGAVPFDSEVACIDAS